MYPILINHPFIKTPFRQKEPEGIYMCRLTFLVIYLNAFKKANIIRFRNKKIGIITLNNV